MDMMRQEGSVKYLDCLRDVNVTSVFSLAKLKVIPSFSFAQQVEFVSVFSRKIICHLD